LMDVHQRGFWLSLLCLVGLFYHKVVSRVYEAWSRRDLPRAFNSSKSVGLAARA
jgi:hypothetical protein